MKALKLHKSLLVKILMFPILISLSGCVYLVVGGIGAVGGYVVSPDTVEGVTENDIDVVWDSVVEIASIMGTIIEEYKGAGMLVAKINGAKVTITATSLNDSSVKILVKSRKYGFPRIGTSQDVFVKIMSYLNE